MTLAKTSLGAGLALILAGLTVLALKAGTFAWAATPPGKATVAGFMFVALAGWLIVVVVRDAHRKRTAREAQEWADLDEWERQMYAEMSPWLDDDDVPVRPVTRADPDVLAEAARLDRQNLWPQPLSPRLVDHPWAAAQPMPPRYWLGDPKPMAEVTSYTGAAAWFATDMRTGVDVSDGVIDAIVPVSGGPRHALGVAEGTETQQWLWTSNTGAWPVVRELAGASA
jgi:hypothetical protein